MAVDVDVVVVGAGLAGAATAWSVARRGSSVLVLEQFAPGHRLGSSHGSARIVRRAYGDALYTRLAGQAFELWREIERESGVPILRMLGGLDFGPGRDVPTIAAVLAEVGVAHEVLPAAEAQRRWPGMLFDGPVVYHPQAGTMDADAAVAAFVEVAGRCGAEVRFASPVTSVASHGDVANVELADGSRVSARCAVVAAGAWLGPLLDGVLELPPLRVTQQQLFHFPRRDRGAEPWPSVIHQGRRSVYHLAGGRDGGAGEDRKLGEHDYGAPTTGDDRDGVVDRAARRRVVDYVRRWLPGLEPTPSGAATCLYTSTPSEDFVIDRQGPVVVCSPCSGHGAKFAPLIGELVADLVDGSGTVPDRFRLTAHALGHGGSVSL